MSIVRLGTAPRAAGLSYADFQAHWSGQHAGLAGGIPGLRRYLQNHAVLRDGNPLLPYTGFDACSEIEFDTLEAMEAGFASDFYRSDVTADELDLIDKPRFMLALAERRSVRAGEPDEGAVKLLSFWRTTPRSTDAELHATLGDGWADAVADSGAVRHEQLLTLADAQGEWAGPVADATDILTFASADDALAFLASPAAQEGHWRLGGIGACVGRLIAREVVVA